MPVTRSRARIVRLFRMAAVLIALSLAAVLPAAGALAFSKTPGADAAAADPDYQDGNAALADMRYEEALDYFRLVTERDPEHADAWSQTGFALRKLGRFEESLDAYYQALEIAPFHLGANSYLGELYLALDEPDMAEEMIDILERACPKGCEELSALQQAIMGYRRSGGAVKWDKRPSG